MHIHPRPDYMLGSDQLVVLFPETHTSSAPRPTGAQGILGTCHVSGSAYIEAGSLKESAGKGRIDSACCATGRPRKVILDTLGIVMLMCRCAY